MVRPRNGACGQVGHRPGGVTFEVKKGTAKLGLAGASPPNGTNEIKDSQDAVALRYSLFPSGPCYGAIKAS